MYKAVLVSFLFVLFDFPPAVRAEGVSGTESRSESYWGEITASADSNTARFEQRGKPLWEKALDIPYMIAAAPVYFFFQGAKGTVIFLDENAKVRRTLMHILHPRFGPFRTSLSLSGGGLQGFGLNMKAVAGEGANRVKIGGKYTSNSAARATLGVLFTPAPRTRLQFGLGYRIVPNARYFGLGPHSSEVNESYYTRESGWGGVSLARDLGADLTSEFEILFSGVGAYDTRRNEDSLSTVFSDDLPDGFGSRSDGVGYSFALIHDDTREVGRPEGGGIRRARATYFQDNADANENFWTYRMELQQFVPLWFSKRALALRGFISWMDTGADEKVPFQRLMINDDPDIFRGYRDFRYTDRGLTSFSAEYRWPVWAAGSVNAPGIDACLFADAGQVFGDRNDLSELNMRNSVGGGFRWVSGWGFGGRLEVARSAEEWVVRLRGDQVFQYAKSGLLYGRNPIPPR